MFEALGLYLSIPFCRSKCSYCNFASGVYPASAMALYVSRLIADLRAARGWANENYALLPNKIDSIYLGGGTPSLLPPPLLEQIFAAIHSEFEVTADAEITLECAPGQIDDAVLKAMVEAGVNRVSFGVQSFVDREAAVTGRLHSREVALAEICRMQSAGIDAINVDLIAGLPHQTSESWRESLRILAETGVNHSSIYMFEVDEDSRLGRELLNGGHRYHAASVPDDDEVADFYETACDFLAQQGVAQYEISNFARDGGESRHNLKYWQRKPYLGLGLDAHSMLQTKLQDKSGAASQTRTGDVLRLATTDDLQHFLDGDFSPEVSRVSIAGQLEEAWFLGLRLNRGVSLEELRVEFGTAAITKYADVVEELRLDALLEDCGECLRLTRKGRLLSNEVFEKFLLAEKETAPEELICIS